MPWLSIFMAILGFLTSLKKNPGNKGRAVAVGALAGLGTYYVSHNTEWGSNVLGPIDGVTSAAVPTVVGQTETLPDGSKVPIGASSTPSSTTGQTSGLAQVLTSWGPTGTAAVIGTAALSTSSSLQKYLPWLIIAGVIVFLNK